MNVDTGKLVNGEEMEELVQQMMKRMSVPHSEALRMVSTEGWTTVSPEDFTPLQKENQQVSKHDNRSVLGKKFTNARKKKRIRRQPKNFKW